MMIKERLRTEASTGVLRHCSALCSRHQQVEAAARLRKDPGDAFTAHRDHSPFIIAGLHQFPDVFVVNHRVLLRVRFHFSVICGINCSFKNPRLIKVGLCSA